MENVYGQLIIHPDFFNVIEDLKKARINIKEEPFQPVPYEDMEAFAEGASNFEEEAIPKDLDPNFGYQKITSFERPLCAYDESMISVPALEGTGYFFSHALVVLSKNSYIPIVNLTFNFFTRSKKLANGKNKITYCEDISVKSKEEYIKQKTNLLEKYVPDDCILLLDGPLITGQISSRNIGLNSNLLLRDIIPIFLVKNSNSSIVVDSINELKDKYNSDFEWAFKTLKTGQRGPLVYYEDKYNKNNAKYFTYIKVFNRYILRVEFHKETFRKYKNEINAVFDIIYYELLSQGSTNPQPKIVAVAETYARETLNMINVKNILFEIGVTPTMNYTRFGWK